VRPTSIRDINLPIKEQSSPASLARISNLQLKAGTSSRASSPACTRALINGFSVEFAEHRLPAGDPIRHIDWKVYARTDRYVIKRFQEETI